MANYKGFTVEVDSENFEKKIKQIRQFSEEKAQEALDEMGFAAVAFATINITRQKAVDTGWLRDHIDYKIKGDAVYVGSAVHYAAYVEYGTGDLGTGTGPKWTYYVPDGKYKGFHQTSGMKPRPFLRPAATKKECLAEYRVILIDKLNEAIKKAGADGS